jgi:cell division protein FtsW (lipid II flippase)
MSARNRELLGLLPASALVVAGFAAVFVQRHNVLSNVSLTYGILFLALCLAAHVFLRITLPYADPYLFPLVALLASFGIVMIYRIDATDARQQAQWFVVGLILFAATILMFRDYRRLEQYRYVIVAISLVLLLLPRAPGIGEQVNGAYLNIKLPGGITFQPTEFSKIGLVIFLASYLRDTRQVLVQGARRFLGVTLPPLKHFGPVLVIWGVAMLALVLLSDIGSSVMFYGALLAMLYVATGRVSFVVIGLLAFVGGAWFLGAHIAHVHARFEVWQHALNPRIYNAPLGSFQVANGNFAMAAGGLFGQGFGESIITVPGTHSSLIPEADTDMIYAVITSEVGLFGAIGILIGYLLFVWRGFKTAMLCSDSFSKLMAVGLTSVFALQVFVIVGGVTRVIPLTGVTLPFISYGGASIVANFVLLALLLLISNRARRPVRVGGGGI